MVPVPVKTETPEKVATPEEKTPPVKVVTPETTVRVTPRKVEKEEPVLPSRTNRDEELGELSSIFAGGDDDNGNAANPYAVPSKIPGGEDDDDDNGKITGKWWFWTSIGVGAALIGGGSWLLYDQLSGSDGGSKYNATVRW